MTKAAIAAAALAASVFAAAPALAHHSAVQFDFTKSVPIKGVVDVDGGYRVGVFSGREIGEGDTQWQDRIDSFKVAVRAATMVSEHYAKEKNTASASYYRTVAKQLDAQLDED